MVKKLLISAFLILLVGCSWVPPILRVPTPAVQPTAQPVETQPEITIFPLDDVPEGAEVDFQNLSSYDQQRIIGCNWVEEETSLPTEFYPNGRTWAESHQVILVMKDDVLLGVNVRKAPYVTAPIWLVMSKDVRVLTDDGWQYFPQRFRVTTGEGGWLRINMGWDTDYGLFILPGWVHGSNFRMVTEDDPDYSLYLCY